ncbi:hypothetical protein [Alsobacter soli]|uniref:hypothetical protein n=1 Tax=Alsobacter soli TaxID=2109933 RepID=UPI0011B1CFAE|nr:hypothetical protein [Alsobacter soli]
MGTAAVGTPATTTTGGGSSTTPSTGASEVAQALAQKQQSDESDANQKQMGLIASAISINGKITQAFLSVTRAQ